MSGAPRDPKSKQSGGDLKISLTPAGLFVVAMIVFLCRRNLRLRANCSLARCRAINLLRRIPSLLKELTAKEKDYLYAQVERARGFTKLAIIPFVRGRTKPEQYQIDHTLSYLEKPEFKKLFEDPTVVLVVAAYADKQGSDEQNLQISKERATNLMKILQNQGHVTNTVRAVGMGGLDFFDKNDAEKNRIAEVWLVAP